MSQPFMQLYVGDYIRDTMDLSTEEHGAYLLLLMTMWSHGAKLPNDQNKLARIARLSPAKFKRVWAAIERFFTVEGDCITQGRLTKEHEKAKEKGQKRAEAGAKGGKAKALKNKDTGLANATVLLKHLPEPEPDIREEDTNVSLQVSPAGDVSEAVRIYNDAAAKTGWPSVQKLTPTRSRSLRARISEAGGMDGWRHAVDRATQSDFLSGRTAKPWTGFGFDWLTKAANFTKLMEGNYDNRDCNRRGQSADMRQNRPDPALEQALRLAGLS